MNIREYLDKLDNEALENNTKYYDLRNLYDSSKLDKIDELKLQAMVDNNASADRIFNELTNGSSDKMIDEALITVEVPDEDVEAVFAKFEELLNNTYIDYDMVASKAEAMYEPHKGDPIWDAAFKKWNCEDCCCEEEPCEEPMTLRNKLGEIDSNDICDECDFFDLRNNYDNANLSAEDQEELNKMILDGASEKEIYNYLQNKIKPEEVFNNTEEVSPIETLDKDKILTLFASLMDNRYVDADSVFAEAEKLYKPHAGEAVWDSAYAEFTGKTNKGLHESLEVKVPEKSISEFLEELDKVRFVENKSYVGMKDLFEAASADEKKKDADFIRQNANNPDAISAYFAGKNSKKSANESLSEEKEILTESNTEYEVVYLDSNGQVIDDKSKFFLEEDDAIEFAKNNGADIVTHYFYENGKLNPSYSEEVWNKNMNESLEDLYNTASNLYNTLLGILGEDEFEKFFVNSIGNVNLGDLEPEDLSKAIKVMREKLISYENITESLEDGEEELYDIELEWVSDFDEPSLEDVKFEVKQLASESDADSIELIDFIPVEGETFNKVIIRGTEDDLRNCLITYCAGDDINAEVLLDNAVKVVDTDVEVANEEEPVEEKLEESKEVLAEDNLYDKLKKFADTLDESVGELPSEITYTFDDLCPEYDFKSEQEVADIVMDKLNTDYGCCVSFKLDLQPDCVRVYEIEHKVNECNETLIESKKCSSDNVCIGDFIKIINMEGEPQYEGKEGTVTDIDDIDQIHGTWGSCALIPGVDKYEVTKNTTNENLNINDKSFYVAYIDKHGNDAAYVLNANSEKDAEDKFKFLDLGEFISVSETTKDELNDMQDEINMGFIALDESIDPADQLKMELESALNDFLNIEGGKAEVEVMPDSDFLIVEIDGVDAYENAEKVEELDHIVAKFDKDAYFDAEDYGIIRAFIKVDDKVYEGLDGDKTEYDNGKECPDCHKKAVFEVEDTEDADGNPIWQCQNCGKEYVKAFLGKFKPANFKLKEKLTLKED